MNKIGFRSDQLAHSPRERSRVIRVIEAGHNEHTKDKRKIQIMQKMKSAERRNKTGLNFIF